MIKKLILKAVFSAIDSYVAQTSSKADDVIWAELKAHLEKQL